MVVDNGFTLNLDTIRSILLKIYENKPDFPIGDKEILAQALGGENQLFLINENIGEKSALDIADKSFIKQANIEEPNQIIDAILGDSFINIITKIKLLETIKNLDFPIETKDKFAVQTKNLITFGIPMETIAEKLDYPIEKPEQILNRIKLIDSKLLEAKTELIANIEDSKFYKKIVVKPSEGEIAKKEKVLKFSESYLFEEDKPKISFDIFKRAIASDIKSLCISRTHPQQLEEKYQVSSGQLLWLTDSESSSEMTVKPALESLMYKIEEFIQQNPKSLLILDGLEYLISINDFNPVLQFIRSLKDKISEQKTIFILALSPGAIDEQQVKLIEREIDQVDTEVKITLPKSEDVLPSEEDRTSIKNKLKTIIESGKDAYREKKYEYAIRIYDEGLKLDPDNTEIRFLKKTVEAKIRDLAKEVEGGEQKIPPTSEIEKTPESAPTPEQQAERPLEAPEEPALSPSSLPDKNVPVQEESADIKPGTEFDIDKTKFDFENDKIEQIEKRLQEKVKELKSLSSRPGEPQEDACKSCEGTGECYWCNGSGKCNKCSGSGKEETGNDCPDCKGTGICNSCQSSGKCHWCQGSGKKKA